MAKLAAGATGKAMDAAPHDLRGPPEKKLRQAVEVPTTTGTLQPATRSRKLQWSAEVQGPAPPTSVPTDACTWAAYLYSLAMAAPPSAANVQRALASRHAELACRVLWGTRRPRTLRSIGHILKNAAAYWGNVEALFAISEQDVINYLKDKADEPCGRSTPPRIVARWRWHGKNGDYRKS